MLFKRRQYKTDEHTSNDQLESKEGEEGKHEMSDDQEEEDNGELKDEDMDISAIKQLSPEERALKLSKVADFMQNNIKM